MIEAPDISCPVCSEVVALDKSTGDGSPVGRRAVRCPGCGAAFTAPTPHDDDTLLEPDLQQETAGRIASWYLDSLARGRIRRVERQLAHLGRPLRILDVGGGTSVFGLTAARRGHGVTVVEPNARNAANTAGCSGLEFVPAFFGHEVVERLGAREFDAITFWHSLEHFPKPTDALALAGRLLADHGLIVTDVPNFGSYQARLGKQAWCYLDLPHHHTQFDPESLEHCVTRAHLRVVCKRSWTPHFELFGWFQTSLNAMAGTYNEFYQQSKKGVSTTRSSRSRLAHGLIALPAAASVLLSTASVVSRSACCLEWYMGKL